MGADNQAEKVLSRMEREQAMAAEIMRLRGVLRTVALLCFALALLLLIASVVGMTANFCKWPG